MADMINVAILKYGMLWYMAQYMAWHMTGRREAARDGTGGPWLHGEPGITAQPQGGK